MQIKIAVFITKGTYPQAYLEKSANNLGIEIIYSERYLDDPIGEAKKLEDKGINAIISRGITMQYLLNNIKIPIVALDETSFDIFYRIHLFKNKNPHINKLGIIIPSTKEVEYRRVGKLLAIKLIPYYYSKKEDICDLLNDMKAQVNDVITFSTVARDIIIKEGLNPVLITAGRIAILNCLTKAKELVVEREKGLARTSRLDAIVNIANVGIISINKDSVVRVFNLKAEDILGVTKNNIIDRSVNEIHQEYPTVVDFIENTQTVTEPTIMEANNNKIIVTNSKIKDILGNHGRIISFEKVSNIERMERKIRVQTHPKGLKAKYSFDDIIGESSVIKQLIEAAKFFAKTNSTVLITGESGCGKELFAQSIHNSNKNTKDGPFVAINCAALPESLLESELFGYDEGAFTGAKKGGKMGLFELAHNGTIFLDEIAEMPIKLQANLLRVLEEKEVMRIGSNNVIPIDVRIIAAANRDLKVEVSENRFRMDLYYRLNILSIHIPPLRERKDDIPVLANLMFKEEVSNYGELNAPVCQDALSLLKTYDWPGNVRELRNFIEKLTIFYMNTNVHFEKILADMLEQLNPCQQMERIANDGANTISINIDTFENMEKEIITKLDAKLTNKSELIKVLGLNRTTIWRKLKNYEQH